MPDDREKKKDDAGKAQVNSSKKILWIVVGLLVLIIAGGGGFFIWNRISAKDEAGVKNNADQGKPAEKEKVNHQDKKLTSPGEFFALEPFIVNLQDNVGTRYLKLSIHLEMDEAALEETKNRMVQIRDSIIILLSSKSYSDVGVVQGKYRLRDEIAARINQILTQGKVRAVYFTEFVIQ